MFLPVDNCTYILFVDELSLAAILESGRGNDAQKVGHMRKCECWKDLEFLNEWRNEWSVGNFDWNSCRLFLLIFSVYCATLFTLHSHSTVGQRLCRTDILTATDGRNTITKRPDQVKNSIYSGVLFSPWGGRERERIELLLSRVEFIADFVTRAQRMKCWETFRQLLSRIVFEDKTSLKSLKWEAWDFVEQLSFITSVEVTMGKGWKTVGTSDRRMRLNFVV